MKKPVPTPASSSEPILSSPTRRAFLNRGALLAGGLAGGALLPFAHGRAADAVEPPPDADLPPKVPRWMQAQGRPVGSMPYGEPSAHEEHVIRRLTRSTATTQSSWSFTPLQNLHGIITPNGLVFERHHAGIPDIDPERHRLLLHGLVKRPLMFTMNDLMRFPAVSRIYFLECSGNTLTEWEQPEKETVQFTHGLLSCCEWTGVMLSTLLQEVGVEPDGRWFLAEGADAAGLTRSVPMEKAWKDAMLVYAQNGEMLRPEQGYPLRLFLPGYEGNMSVKWLRRIKIGDQPFHSRQETSKYTDLMPDGRAREFSFEMEAKSVITSPSGGQRLHARGFHEISGLAWSGYGRVGRVDVSTDGGRHWRVAELQEPVLAHALTRFRLPWEWDGSPAVLQSRVVDEAGYVQPTHEQLVAARGVHSVYHYNAIQSWGINADGEVRNVRA
ncbi:sulfite dehydrogenase [Ectothiorhodospiraceae bacterium 2226]|nr:sulfite dehydrogenase [Ectothiorhodospiraceae bacterium 2226]